MNLNSFMLTTFSGLFHSSKPVSRESRDKRLRAKTLPGLSSLPFLQWRAGLALFGEQVLGLDLILGEGHADGVGIIG
jgi:hypothetical protein